MKQIGGEIQISDLILEGKRVVQHEDQVFLSHGRAAINLILKSIKPTGIFLLPSFLCESILQPFKNNNFEIDFYEIDEFLSFNIDEMDSKINTKNVQGIYIINFFGFKYNSGIIQFLKRIKKELLIIEDDSHGSLSGFTNPSGIGHFIFSSIRKYLPLPDGCILINHSGIQLKKNLIIKFNNRFFDLKFSGRLLKSIFNSDLHEPDIESVYLKLLLAGENFLDLDQCINSISDYSYNALSTIDFPAICSIRQENFNQLLKLFVESNLSSLPILGMVLNESFPFVFPVKVNSEIRDKLRTRLVQENLFCPILWPFPGVLDPYLFPKTFKLSQSVLCLPVDQRYNIEDMKDLFTRFVTVYTELNKIL